MLSDAVGLCGKVFDKPARGYAGDTKWIRGMELAGGMGKIGEVGLIGQNETDGRNRTNGTDKTNETDERIWEK